MPAGVCVTAVKTISLLGRPIGVGLRPSRPTGRNWAPFSWGDLRITNFSLNTTLLQERLDSMEEAKYFKFKKIVEDSFEENEENLIGFGLNILNLRR
jgi:hypothetical protein